MIKDEDVKKSEKIFESYKQSDRGTFSEHAVEDRAFVANVMWTSADAKALEAANQPVLTINETTPARNQVLSKLTKNSPRWASYGKEKSDVTTASYVSDIMEHIWYLSDGDTSNSKATEDFIDVGMWAMMVYVDSDADYGRGEIKVTDLDPLEVYIDPSSKRLDTEDAAHKLIVKRVTKEYIKNIYPNFNFENTSQSYEDDIEGTSRSIEEGQVLKATDDNESEYYLIIDRYTKIKVTKYHVDDGTEHLFSKKQYDEYWQQPAIVLTRAGTEEYISDDENVKYWMSIIRQYGKVIHYMSESFVDEQGQMQENLQIMSGLEHPESIPGSTTQITVVNKGYLIKTGKIESRETPVDRIKRVLSIGGKLHYKDTLPISRYPIQTTMNQHQRNPFPIGDIRLVRPLQEQLNKITSKITAYISAITNLIAFVQQGSNTKKQLETQAGKAGLKVIEIDTEVGSPPSFAQYPPLPAGIFQERQNIINQIQRIMGAYPMMDGDTSRAPDTYRATLVIQEEGQDRITFKRKRIETAINNLAKVVAELIPKVYTEKKMIRLLKPNHQVKEVTFNEESYENGAREIKNDLSVVNCDIVMISGSMLPTNRWARSEYYTGLYEKGILQDASVILRESEIPDVEEIIEKQDKLNQAMQYIQQLEGQLKQITGDKQTTDRENLHLKQRVEVEKVKSGLKEIEYGAKASVELGKARINDEVRKTKQTDPKGKETKNK